MKTSYIIDQENRVPASMSQPTGTRSQSLGRQYNPSTSLGLKSSSVLQSISPQSFTQNYSPATLKGKSPEQQLEEAQTKIALLNSELARVNKENSELKKENEMLKLKSGASQDAELSAKLAIILAENGKLNYALEKLREAYQREKINNTRQSDKLSQSESRGGSMSGNLRASAGHQDKETVVTSENKAEAPSEDYEKKIMTLYEQNDKLNDALEQKIKEVGALSVRLGEEKSLRSSRMSESHSQFMESANFSKTKEVRTEESNLGQSQEFSGMVQALLQENSKLIELVNRKDQEMQGLSGKSVKGQGQVVGESAGKGAEQSGDLAGLKVHLDEIINKNMMVNRILSQQAKVIEDYKHNFSTIDQFKVSTNKLVEENHKISKLLGESIHSLREEFMAALNVVPSGANELRAKVSLLSEENANMSNVLRDKLTEIGALKEQINQLQHSLSTKSSAMRGGDLTMDDLSTKQRLAEERFSLGQDQEFQTLKALVADLQDSSVSQSSHFKELKMKLDNMGAEIGKLALKKAKKMEDKESYGQNKKAGDANLQGRVVFGDVSNVEGQRGHESVNSISELLNDKMKDFENLKHHYTDIKYCVSELLAETKKDDSLKSQIDTLVKENEKMSQALREKEKSTELVFQQLKKLQEGFASFGHMQHSKGSIENLDVIIEKFEEIRQTVSEVSEEGIEETRELKSNVGLVLSELTQLKKDFVNYHLELKMLKSASSGHDQDRKASAIEEERLKGMVQTLMHEKEEIYAALRQKDSEFDAVKSQKHELSEKVIILSGENKNLNRLLEEKDKEINYLNAQIIELQEAQERLEQEAQERAEQIHHEENMLPSERQEMDVGRSTPGEMASRTDIDASYYSEEATPVKAQIKRRPLTEEEAIVQENFQGKIDIVFCVDCTKSMDPYIMNAKLACSKIITVMNQSKNNFPLDLKFGFVGYRDHGNFNGNTWVTKVHDLGDAETCIAFINKMDAHSSTDNDFPEAVMPALWDCAEKITWRDNLKEKTVRIVFHIADAPPHGKRFYKGKNDQYPKGDPTGIKTDHVAQKFADLGISYKVLKIGKFLDLMEKVFKQTFLDIECMELKKAEHLDQMTTAILIKHLDMVNNQISIKDKRFLNLKPKGNMKRTDKVGQCYFSSILFDDYFEYFVEENISEFKVRTLNLFYTKDALIGVQCIYVTKDEEIEAPARMAINNGVRKVALEFGPKEYITEISGEVDQRENLCSLTLMTNMNKKVVAGGPGARKFKLPTPPTGYILTGVGGSFRNRGIDSIYFYYV